MDAKETANKRWSSVAGQITVSLQVNGDSHEVQVSPTARLIDILREDLELTGTKRSCDIGRCGACSVLVNGSLVNSCLVMAYQVNHASVTTIEERELSYIQQAFLKETGFQCGYCTPGMIVAVKELLDASPLPTEAQIRAALAGNLCRCTGYGSIIRAVQRAAAAKLIMDRCGPM